MTNSPKYTQDILEKIFTSDLQTPAQFEIQYPERNLPTGAMVTRVGPSPTGLMHIGGIYMALISQRFARQTGGVYFLRIEDTDKKREMEGATKVIIDALATFNLTPDEGQISDSDEKGSYGPYSQSERVLIYQSYIKSLLEQGDAYLCFCSSDELKQMNDAQAELKVKPGYYGKWAKWRDADLNTVRTELEKGTPYVIRLRSRGDGETTFTHHDLLKGDIELPQNDMDVVIMKSDGLPTYHFAHAVDDHLMRTTHVLRGDEWVSSLPTHYELFEMLGFKIPYYGHIAPINKIDSGNKRKLSKRKDPEANVLFYQERGYPPQAVIEYLMNLANSDFEDWRKANPTAPHTDFELTMKRLANSNGPLFSEDKLGNISKTIIASMDAKSVYDEVIEWSKKYNPGVCDMLVTDSEYWTRVFSIERGGPQARKDLAMWADVPHVYNYFDVRKPLERDWANFKTPFDSVTINAILNHYSAAMDINLSKEDWLNAIRNMCAQFGCASDMKTFKTNKENYKGHIGDVTQVIRFALTGKTQTSDLYEVIKVLGESESKKRLLLN